MLNYSFHHRDPRIMIAQEAIVAKSQELHQVVDQLVTIVVDAIRDHTPIHTVEGKGMKVLLQAGQKALQLLVDCLGNGDVGQEYQLPDGNTVKRSDERQSRTYVSIFGKIDIRRTSMRNGKAKRSSSRPSTRVWPCQQANSRTCCRIGTRTLPWKNRLGRWRRGSRRSWG